jgi:hypothetical protein
MNGKPLSIKLTLAFGTLLGLYSAAVNLSRFSEPFKMLQRRAPWLLPEHEDSQLSLAYEKMGQADPARIKEAITIFTALMARNPASPYRWCDLGEVLFDSGDTQQARYCLSRAYEFGSHVAPILMRIANLHFRLGETRQAVDVMAKILTLVADYDAVIFSYYDRMGVSTADILNYGLPADPRRAQSYLRHLLRSGRLADADKTWRWIVSYSAADQALACEYGDFLLKNHEYEKAAKAWAGFISASKGDYLEGNYLFNGDFESEPVKCPLDWQISEVANVEVTRDSSVAHSGKWSLRIRFQTEENLNYQHVSQTAYVRSGPARFQAFLKASGITTDQGVGFHIFDPESPARLDIFTEQFTGTSDWRKVESSFVIPANTRALTIQVVRRSSLRFDNQIRGTVWIDGLTLQPVGRNPVY